MMSLQDDYQKSKQAWLITWDWIGDHARVDKSFVALLNFRYSDGKIARIIEQLYVTSKFAIFEQLAYAKNRKSNPYSVQYGTVEMSGEIQNNFDVSSHVKYAGSMICGSNPWLWARLVYDVEAFINDAGQECLIWKERGHSFIEKGKMKSEWEECQCVFKNSAS